MGIRRKAAALAAAAALSVSMLPAAQADADLGVMVNGQYVTFADQAPANIDSRVLVPVRAVMENIGATVNWDANTRQVTITKDGTTVAMWIDNPVITVNGAEQTIDVAPKIINDRTLLPIRAVAEAFGCNVGWDDENKTVIVVNVDEYVDDIKTKASNFYSFMEDQKENALIKNYTSSCNMDFKLTLDIKNEGVNSAAAININVEDTANAAENGTQNVAKINVKTTDLEKTITELTGISTDGIDLSKLGTIDLELRIIGEDAYIKTNLFEELGAVIDNKELSALAAVASTNTWMKINMAEFLQIADIPGANQILTLMTNPQAVLANDMNTVDGMANLAKNTDYNSVDDAMYVNNIARALVGLYNNNAFKYEKTENGYTVTVDLDKNDYAEVMQSEFGGYVDDINSLLDIMDVQVKMNITGDNTTGKYDSNAECVYSINIDEDGASAKIGMELKINSSGQRSDSVAEIEVPTDAIDIISLLDMLNL